MKKKIITGAFALFLTASSLWAVPAKRGVIRFQQPDGTKVELCKIGDERSHMVLSPEGYPLTVDSDGYMCFAEINNNGRLSATQVKAADLKTLTPTQRAIVERIDRSKIDEVLDLRYESSKMSEAAPVVSRAVNTKGIGLMDDAFVGRKELKGLVILAQYSDVKFKSTNDRAFFEEMLNSEGFSQYNGTGSARDYFIDNSGGAFIPEFDVYGPVTLNHPMSYYGGNDGNGNDSRPAQMIYDACKGLDGEINFADYDQDGDGYVDNVFVFYAGYGEASYGTADSVWPHQWALSSGGLSLILDGVRVNKYACSNELVEDSRGRVVPDGIGTFVHEFSHVLGLPDLYVTSGSGDWTPGEWSVMDQGPYNNDSRTPPAYSAYERYSLGWLDPIELTGATSVTLDAINKSNQACIVPTSSENEFFLLENRQQTGWDTYIPGHGMLIWHIDYRRSIWTGNKVNNSRTHNYVDIEEACGTTYSIRNFGSVSKYMEAMAGYAFPGTKNVTEFTDTTKPSMLTWSNQSLGLPITGIEESNGLISFDVAGGRCDAEVPKVKDQIATGNDWFEAAWDAAYGAVGYILNVAGKLSGENQTEEGTDFGTSTSKAEIPEGWEFISTTGDVSTSSGQYGKSAPSLRLSKNGAGILTRKYNSNVKSVEFWSRGYLTGTTAKVTVEGLINNEWTTVESVAVASNAGKTSTVNMPEGVKQLRLTVTRSNGNVFLDDVLVILGGGWTTLDGYSELEVGNVTSYKVPDLPADYEEFEFKVRAIDASGHLTHWSEPKNVTVGLNSGIVDAELAGAGNVYVDGRSVRYKGVPGVKLILTDLCGRTIAVAQADESGEAFLTVPDVGFYVLAASGQSFKLSVR